MSSHSPLSSSFLHFHPHPKPKPKPKQNNPPKLPFYPSLSSHLPPPNPHNDQNTPTPSTSIFLSLSLTLTIISSSLPHPPSSLAATPKKPQKKRPFAKKIESLSPQDLQAWAQGLPLVTHTIPYTDILTLMKQGKLKHVVKTSAVHLKQQSLMVLVVLDDDRVVRTVLPSFDSHRKFWDEFDELKIESLCVNAYMPPVKGPDLPNPVLRLPFGDWMRSYLSWSSSSLFVKVKPKRESKKAAELRRVRMELQREKEEEIKRVREEREMMERSVRMQKREEERRRKAEMRRKRTEESLSAAKEKYEESTYFWRNLALNDNLTTFIGAVFFIIFYRTVVLNYKKQKKDYEDRLKIEQAEAEERKKMRALEREMDGLEGEDDDEVEPGKEEENAYLKMAKQFMKSGARVRRAQNKKLPQYLERGVDVKFTDVAGLGKIRLELEEIVKFFTHGEMYQRRGVKIPGGILLCGPPGVGKTLLAKAVAGEAGVNFFSISASQFVEIYVGVGASRVRALYEEARDMAPSVVFIDELDAVGRERGLIKGSGGQERDATLNQLLVCLDGFEGRGEVITIASTNRPDILDPALVRPGRFDRKIFIPKPGLIGRVEILKVHARKKPVAEDVDYMAVASMTDGMVGAEIANIVEVAAINMIRDGRTEITTDDLLQAAQMEERGMLDRKQRSLEAWKQIAINEAAMAVVAVNFPDLKNIEFVTIAPRAGRELGYVRMKMDSVKFREGMLTRQSLLDHITVQLAPRAADELWYGNDQLSTIWAETADNARSAARTFVLGGLSEKYHGISNFYVADRINEIDLEAMRIVNSCYEQAKEILEQNRTLMDVVVSELVEKKSITKLEFFHLVERYGSIRPMPPSILDIRASKLQQSQELKNQKEAALRSRE